MKRSEAAEVARRFVHLVLQERLAEYVGREITPELRGEMIGVAMQTMLELEPFTEGLLAGADD